MKNLIIILGSPNTKNGELLPMAQGRLNRGLEISQDKDKNHWLITLTGGFGDHFNITKLPHAHYAKQYLMSKGLEEQYFTELALSCDTVDDAKQCLPIVKEYQPDEIIVVSSDFHIKRVEFIFTTIFPQKNITFYASDYLNQCDKETKNKLLEHEAKELASLQKYGRSKLMGVSLT